MSGPKPFDPAAAFEAILRMDGPADDRLLALRKYVLSTNLDQKPLQKGPGRYSSKTMPPPPKSGSKPTSKQGFVPRPGGNGLVAPKPPHLPVRSSHPVTPGCTLRGNIWKILLGVVKVDAERYIHLVEHGPCERHELILVDLKRTFKSDASFQASVSQDKLIRVLNAFDRWCKGQNVVDPSFPLKEYVHCQGMDLLAGVLLYVLPELDAFFALQKVCLLVPLHFHGGASGAHMLCKLSDVCLQAHDPQLHHHLVAGMSSATSSEPGSSGHSSGTGETAPVYSALFAFPRMFSLYACVPPVSSAVKLWDYMLAKGLYTLVLMVVADIELRRDVLLTESRNPVIVLERSKYDAIDVPALLRQVEKIEAELHLELLEAIKTCPAIRVPDSAFAEVSPPVPAARQVKTSTGRGPPKPPVNKPVRRK